MVLQMNKKYKNRTLKKKRSTNNYVTSCFTFKSIELMAIESKIVQYLGDIR